MTKIKNKYLNLLKTVPQKHEINLTIQTENPSIFNKNLQICSNSESFLMEGTSQEENFINNNLLCKKNNLLNCYEHTRGVLYENAYEQDVLDYFFS